MEIEKKFAIIELPSNLEQYVKKEIEQGYLCTKPVVRIRKSNEDYYLTYKSPFYKDGDKEQVTIVNNEVEIPIDSKAYEHLKEKIDNQLIVKTRYLIPLWSNLIGELDIFHGCLEGLAFIEVEFASEEDAKNFVPPSWFGKDVSMDDHYKNNYLTQLNSYDEWYHEVNKV